MIDLLLTNVYIRLFIATMLALIIAFSHELSILNERWMLGLIGVLLIMILIYDPTMDNGIVLLLVALFIVVYNQQSRNQLMTEKRSKN